MSINYIQYSYGNTALTFSVCGAAYDVGKFGLQTGVGDAIPTGGLEASGPQRHDTLERNAWP